MVCQGVPGAFSHKAALEFFGDISPDFVPTWKEAFEEVAAGKADYAVLPGGKLPPPGLSPGCTTSSSGTGFTSWAPWT